jgi:anti-anti-sigma regulatory factor
MIKLTPSWRLDVDRGPDWLMVRVGAPRRRGSVMPSLAEALWSLLEQHSSHRLVLEMDQIDVLDDDLIEQLLELHRRISDRGGLMRLCGLSSHNREVFLQHRLNSQFVPYEDREEAVLGSGPRRPR